jgi:hypothetical protein
MMTCIATHPAIKQTQMVLQTGLDPLSWTHHCHTERCPTCRREASDIPENFGTRWCSW